MNDNHNAWVQDDAMFGGKPVRNREYVTDARGFMSELLAKGLAAHKIDAPLDAADTERLIEFLRTYGDLDENRIYHGSSRAGYLNAGMVEPPQHKGVLDFSELLKSSFWQSNMHFAEGVDQAPMMMEPVGGMDKVVDAFMAKVGSRVHVGAQVQSVMVRDDRVEVTYRERGKREQISADYCLNCIPMHLLAGIPNNFPADYSGAFTAVRARQTAEARPPGERTFLGTRADLRRHQLDRAGHHADLVSRHTAFIARRACCSPHTSTADRPATASPTCLPPERLELAISQGEKVHPRLRRYIESGVSVAWHRMNHMLGCAAEWNDELYQQLVRAPSGARWQPLSDRRPGEPAPRLAGRRDPLGAARDRRHRPARTRRCNRGAYA